MIPDTYRPLFERLLARTTAGEVNWKQTADEKTLAIHISDFTLTMQHGSDYQDNEEFVRWELLNEQGKEIDAFYVSEGEEDWEEAKSLYERARRKAIRLDEALSAIMKELDTDKLVGKDPQRGGKPASTTPFTDDDDLPF